MRNAITILLAATLAACGSNGVDTGDARKVEAQGADGSEVLLLCSEDPTQAVKDLSEKTGASYRRLEGEATYVFDQPLRIDDEMQKVVVSGLETEPCKSGVRRQNSVDAANFGLGVVGVAVVLPLMILSDPGTSYSY